ERKLAPSGCARTWVLISRSRSLIWAFSVRIIVTKPSTSCRCAASSSSPTRPRGALRSLAISAVGSARVSLALEKRLHPRHSKTARIRRAGVALQEREQDLRVHVTEQRKRPGPEPLELRPQLVHDRG